MTSLEARLGRLEDAEAIRLLVAQWAFHVNKGWGGKTADVDAMRSIYVEDAVGEMPDTNSRIEGLEAIMTSLRADTADIEFVMHSLTNPIVVVDQDTATGNWLMWIVVRRIGEIRQVYLSLDHGYLRTGEGWRIATATARLGAIIPEQNRTPH